MLPAVDSHSLQVCTIAFGPSLLLYSLRFKNDSAILAAPAHVSVCILALLSQCLRTHDCTACTWTLLARRSSTVSHCTICIAAQRVGCVSELCDWDNCAVAQRFVRRNQVVEWQLCCSSRCGCVSRASTPTCHRKHQRGRFCHLCLCTQRAKSL